MNSRPSSQEGAEEVLDRAEDSGVGIMDRPMGRRGAMAAIAALVGGTVAACNSSIVPGLRVDDIRPEPGYESNTRLSNNGTRTNFDVVHTTQEMAERVRDVGADIQVLEEDGVGCDEQRGYCVACTEQELGESQTSAIGRAYGAAKQRVARVFGGGRGTRQNTQGPYRGQPTVCSKVEIRHGDFPREEAFPANEAFYR